MSGISFPVTRPGGRILVVGKPDHRNQPVRLLAEQGYDCGEADDPYVAMRELCRNRLAYHSVIFSIASLYHEELNIIATLRRRLPHLEVWLTQAEGRMASLFEGIRLGADGVLAEDGTFHRAASTATSIDPHPTAGGTEISGEHTAATQIEIPAAPASSNGFEVHNDVDDPYDSDEPHMGEPVLSADELRALLQDQPTSMPPANVNEER